jgi:hypothetical protein
MGRTEKLFPQPSALSNELDWSSPVPDASIPTSMVCRVCSASKPLADMTKDRNCKFGYAKICKECDARAHQERYARIGRDTTKQREYYENHKHKFLRTLKDPHFRARTDLRMAVTAGEIVRPSICSRCGVTCTPHGHHEDYSKPLDVVWLCSKCHMKEHRKYK